MKRITLKNCFHDTEVTVLSREETPEATWDVINMDAYAEPNYGPARRKLQRVKNTLCGIDDCYCGIFRPR